MESTDSIRELAPRWSLAGDEKLLGLLQNTHQRIVSKCHEVNTKLDKMATALDSASINLQNVNNRFMALSNSQFIESRVYDDDADVTTETKPHEVEIPDVIDELDLLKRGLVVLDCAHELTEIVDSDTDDSDAQISVVLKPKDVYQHRPLPYIIGSQAWKNKWHAGLMVEDSDTDSVASKPDLMEYSESEDDVTSHRKLPDATISETSSSFHSERDREVDKKQTPADVAAELAARLGNAPPRVLEEPDVPQSTPKVYMPHKPAPSNIFSDEPPPLDYQEYSDKEDDIFAEINKKSYKVQNDDDLFGKPIDYEYEKEQRHIKPSTLFDDDSEPELFDKPNNKEISRKHETEDNVKKPVGGISLFGSNKGTESIGAAILKRNQPKSFSSDESDDDSNIKNDTADDFEEAHNANYIFDNLFAKAKQAEQKAMKRSTDKPVETPKAKDIEKPKESKDKPKSKEVQKSKPKEVKDLFSDNIFDDIDDIFTSNIKIPTKEANKNAKSIFDDDDDVLFSDISKTPKENTKNAKASSSKKSMFDSDDELFSDVKVAKDTKDLLKEKPKESKEPESQKPIAKERNNNTTKVDEISIFDDKPKQSESSNPKSKSKSIFDSDSDEDLFSDIKIKTNLVKKETEIVTDALKVEKSKVFQSPSLFEEDEIDDLFINANKAKLANLSENNKEHTIPENIPEFDNKNEFTEENLDFNDKKNEVNNENRPNLIENVKPVLIDTKPDVFPKIDEPKASDEFKEEKEIKNTKTTSENVSEVINKQKINSINVDIDRELQNTSENTNVDTKNETIFPKIQDLLSDTSKEVPESTHEDEVDKIIESKDQNITDEVIEKPDVIQKSQIPIATFDDIFTEPPAFEKIKEVKKTTNVNALFDDDSDDEALFFRKSDGISDEKPDIFSPSADFGIFNDEPPALVDFTPKNNKDDDLFSSTDKDKQDGALYYPNDKQTPKIFEDNLLSSPEILKDDTKTKSANTILSKEIPDSDEELFSNSTNDDPSPKSEPFKESIDQIDDVKRDKKIGKLNTKNLNINVKALVPGVSPKKILKESNEDTQTNIDTKEIDPKTKDIDTESKTVKSMSFEPAGVLDNNLSKQRPRIQVKRRPSSRKARHEAVRKSVIYIDDDTDNSSSFDEPLPKLNQNKQKKDLISQDNDTFSDDFNSFNEPLPEIQSKESNKHKNQEPETDKLSDDFDFLSQDKLTIDKLLQKSKDLITDDLSNHESHKNTDGKSDEKNILPKDDNNDLLSDTFKQTEINVNVTSSLDEVDTNVKVNENQSTTKVKYVLNDEDIFSGKPKDFTTESGDLFKSEGIKTIENTYKDTEMDSKKEMTTKQPDTSEPLKTVQPDTSKESKKPKKESKSLFDLSNDDDELFGKSTKTKKAEVKSKLFDSDSEEDLFSGKKVKETQKSKEVKVGGSLFDDDDDDLFGAKAKITTTASKTSASTSRSVSKDTKSTEVVFDDPLSMLDDD